MSVDMESDTLLEDQLMPTGELSGDGLPRDGHGRYILPHPVDGSKKGRTRVTTLAALGSSSRGLAIDRERKIVAGMGYRPDLCARAAAAHSSIETDPNAKKLLSEIGEAAYIQAGGNAGANYGTAQHAVFEQFFLHGVTLDKLADYFHADIKAVAAALEFHQLQILPQYIERVIYSILYDRGGKIDAIVKHIPTGDLYILDLKTEEDPIGHPEGKTIQLAYYGNADCMFNYDTGQWEPMPKVRTDVALVVHVRPGKGAETDISKAILTVPIDEGWVGVRAVEMMRSWRQRKLVIAPFITQANWMPPAPVNTNGDVAIANGTISGNTAVNVSTTTPPAVVPTSADASPAVICHVCAVDLSQAPHSAQCPLFTPLTTSNDVVQQNDSASGQYATVRPAPVGNGVHAQVAAIVDQAMAGGQQLNPEQIAELNKQAAAVVAPAGPSQTLADVGLGNPPSEPPGQPVVGPGTPHTIHSGIDAQIQPGEKVEGVPDSRPPAPKSAVANMSAAEHLKQLLDVPPYVEGTAGQPGQGVSPEAETMELAALPKPRLQELIHWASGQQISLDDPRLKKHKKPLADMLVPMLDQQRRMQHSTPVQTQSTTELSPAVTNPPVNGFVDLSYEGVINALNNAISVDQINAIYAQITTAYGPNGWHPDFNNAASTKYTQLTSQQN